MFVLIFVVNPKAITQAQLNQRVGFDELLAKCKDYIPVNGSPLAGALQYCMEAKEFDPRRWELYRQLARLYYVFGEYQTAMDNLKLAISYMVSIPYGDINNPQSIRKEYRTEFALMSQGLSMSYLAAAN